MHLELTNDSLVVHLSAGDRLACCVPFRNSIRIPLASIARVEVRPQDVSLRWADWGMMGLRMGSSLPGFFLYGTVYHWSSPTWFVYLGKGAPQNTLGITLKPGAMEYGRFLLDVVVPSENGDITTAHSQQWSVESLRDAICTHPAFRPTSAPQSM